MAGAHNVRAGSEPHRVEITSFNGFTHEDWDHSTLANDIALIELPEPIEFNDYIKPSCLPTKGHECSPGEMVSVIGWGKPSDSASSISPTLQMVHDIPVMSNSECNDYYGIVGDGIVCIDTTGGRGSCNVSFEHFLLCKISLQRKTKSLKNMENNPPKCINTSG